MQEALTSRQKETIDFIKAFIKEQGIPPTHAEIAKALNCRSNTAASDHLKALVRKGYIKIHSDIPRGIQIITKVSGVPLIGRVAAGKPIEAIENIERHVDLPEYLFKLKPDYLLRVSGDSMKNIGILDNDLIAVRKAQTAESGQIVIARLGEEVTVKRLKIQKNKIWLLPENDAYQAIGVDSDHLYIEGIYTGLLREQV